MYQHSVIRNVYVGSLFYHVAKYQGAQFPIKAVSQSSKLYVAMPVEEASWLCTLQKILSYVTVVVSVLLKSLMAVADLGGYTEPSSLLPQEIAPFMDIKIH